jgi:hypothetical protein
VGFKLEDGESPDQKGVQLDNVLGAIENGETDGIRAFASLKDIGSQSKVFSTRDNKAH